MSEETELATAGILPVARKNLVAASHIASQGSLTTWDDLSKGGVTRETIYDMYKKQFGQRPKSVFVNEGICNKYDHYCYNYYGKASFYNTRPSVMQAVGESTILTNNDAEELTQTAELSASRAKSASLTVTKATEFSYGATISVSAAELGIESQFSYNFTLQNSVGSTSSTKEAVEVKETTTIKLKRGEKVKVDLNMQWDIIKEDFKIPFYIEGWTGADFGHKVNGHHYWFMNLGYLPDGLPSLSYLEGTVETAYNIHGSLVANPAV